MKELDECLSGILMKIVGGYNKGRRLRVSKKGIRPTKGIVRQAIFNILGTKVTDADVLDIFAGTGALGLEAISRGAKHCIFIEKTPKTLFKNIKDLSLLNRTKVLAGDFRTAMKKIKEKRFDIIFLDPPYKGKFFEETLNLISKHCLLKNKGLIIAEHYSKKKFGLPEHLSILKERQYGETAVTFINSPERGDI